MLGRRLQAVGSFYLVRWISSSGTAPTVYSTATAAVDGSGSTSKTRRVCHATACFNFAAPSLASDQQALYHGQSSFVLLELCISLMEGVCKAGRGGIQAQHKKLFPQQGNKMRLGMGGKVLWNDLSPVKAGEASPPFDAPRAILAPPTN